MTPNIVFRLYSLLYVCVFLGLLTKNLNSGIQPSIRLPNLQFIQMLGDGVTFRVV